MTGRIEGSVALIVVLVLVLAVVAYVNPKPRHCHKESVLRTINNEPCD